MSDKYIQNVITLKRIKNVANIINSYYKKKYKIIVVSLSTKVFS